MTKIGYLGPSGSLSESICFELYANSTPAKFEYHLFEHLSHLLEALCQKKIDLAVMPVWNSKLGYLRNHFTQEVFWDKIQATSHLKVLQEKTVMMPFLLLGLPKATLDEIAHIHLNEYSHKLCQTFLDAHAHWKIHTHASSSKAAQTIQKLNDSQHAAIATLDAARQYGLTAFKTPLFEAGDEPLMRFIAISSV